ncbi:MAG: KH domain-containing protein [Syntrophales bacterium]|nr:KH domain-containing protein [Syntrophales bacterium]MCK9528874.1 KH domain-containing protein [Syntrophales bacterium]MDX9921152.1 KH domain-containing protein [Syntrophales bacterium]
MTDLIRTMVKALVSNPKLVEISEMAGENVSVYELTVAKEDRGRIIGKQGQTVKSMRTILNAVSSRSNRKAVLEIVE